MREVAALRSADEPGIVEEAEDARADLESIFDDAPLDDLFEPVVADAGSARGDAGRYIGPYRLVGRLGSGGMGCVYVAEQERPVRRRVAIKLSRPGVGGIGGLDLARARARFDLERQALADLDHPHIAKLLDAGDFDALDLTPDLGPGDPLEGKPHAGRGWPYFVLEYVPGGPITTYCQGRGLDLRQRLGLMLKVCRALQHAHYRGVLHRDLKPGNILVVDPDQAAESGAEDGGGGRVREEGPVPKIIDFGIAAVLDEVNEGGGGGSDANGLPLTLPGTPLGTPHYAAPEQLGVGESAGGSPDVRGDVYSLGVVLYELLTGVLPYGAGYDNPASSWWAVGRAIERGDLLPPGRRLRELAAKRDEAALDRGVPARRVTAEIDAVVMKALAVRPEERYRSAGSLADDLEALLAGRPVAAAAAWSPWYRFQKSVARHRALAASVAVVAVTLAAGAGATGWQAMVATQQRRVADEQRALAVINEQAARDAAALAERSAALAEQSAALAEARRVEADAVAAFATDVFGAADPFAAAEAEDVEGMLDAARTRLIGTAQAGGGGGGSGGGLSLDAKVRLHSELGDAYAVRMLHLRAKRSYADALGLLGEHRPGEPAARSVARLDLKRRLIAAKIELLESTSGRYAAREAVLEAERLLPAGHPLVVRLRALKALAYAAEHDRLHEYLVEVAHDEAHRARAGADRLPRSPEGVLARFEALEAEGLVDTTALSLSWGIKQYDKAVALAEAEPGIVSPYRLSRLLLRRAVALRTAGRHADSLRDVGRHLELTRAVLPEDHPVVLAGRIERARTLAAMGDEASAQRQARAVLRLARGNYPATHAAVHHAARMLSTTLWDRGDREAAVAVWREPLAGATRDDPDGRYAADLHFRAAFWLQWRRLDVGNGEGEGWGFERDPRVMDQAQAWFDAAYAHARRSPTIEPGRLAFFGQASLFRYDRSEKTPQSIAAATRLLTGLLDDAQRRGAGTQELRLLRLRLGCVDYDPHTGFTPEEAAMLMRRSLLRHDENPTPGPVPDPRVREVAINEWCAWIYVREMTKRGELDEADRTFRQTMLHVGGHLGRGNPRVASLIERYAEWRAEHFGEEADVEQMRRYLADYGDVEALVKQSTRDEHPAWASARHATIGRVFEAAGHTAEARAAFAQALRTAVRRDESAETLDQRRADLARVDASLASLGGGL